MLVLLFGVDLLLEGVVKDDLFTSFCVEAESTESNTASRELSPFFVVLLLVDTAAAAGAANCFTARSNNCLMVRGGGR